MEKDFGNAINCGEDITQNGVQVPQFVQVDEEQEEGKVLLVKKGSLNYVLSAIGVGNFHWRLMCICGFGWMADNGWVQSVVMIVPSIQREFSIPDWQIGFLGSGLFIGMAVGSQIWGRWADMMGRRLAFTATLVIAGSFGVASALSVNFGMLLTLYFLVGTGVGGNLPVDGAMFAEFTPRLARGKLLVLLSVFWSLGGFVVALIAWIFIPPYSCPSDGGCNATDNLGWRYVVFIFSMMNILSFLTRTRLPETPAFLLTKGDLAGAKRVLTHMAHSNGHPEDSEVYQEIELLQPRANSQQGQEMAPISSLFKGVHMYTTTLLLWGIWFTSTYGFTGFNMFLTKLMEAKNIHHGRLYRDAFIYSAAGVPGSMCGAYLVDSPLGRKWTMVISTAVTSVCLLFFYLVSNEDEVVVLSCLVNVASQIMFAAYYTYTPEVYRTDIRGRGVGIASGLSRIAGVMAPLINSWLLATGSGIMWPMLVNIGFMVIATCLMAALPLRTKGRPLD